MKWSDRLRFVRQNMAKNKSRVFMTVLAAAMGCAFLIMLASVAFGLQNSLIRDITEGQSLTRIELYDKAVNEEEHAQPDQSDIAVLETMPHVRAVTPRGYVPAPMIRVDDYETRTNALLVDFAAEQAAGLELSEGRMPERPGEAIVGYHFRDALMSEDGVRYNGELLGLSIQLEIEETQVDEANGELQALKKTTAEITVVGVAKKPAREYAVDTEIMLDRGMFDTLMPHSAALGMDPPLHVIYVYADDASHLTKLTSAMRAEGYRLYSPSDQIEEMELFFTVMKIGLGFVGTIAVLIASIGIFNTMTMAVTERAQDIGIMKAIGASPRTIRSIFLLESAGIGILGAVIGAAISYGLSYIVNAVLPPILSSVMEAEVPAGFTFSSIPAGLTIASVAISLLVAMLSGMRPAARATRIDVLRALRRDL